MKSTYKLIKNKLFITATFIFMVTATFAHFGSKGPFAGSVSCGIVNDTLVYLGTTDGGVFFSTKQALTGWSAKPVGLKSGKITALAHSGKYLFAGTADSGVYIYTGFVGTDRYWNKINKGLTNLKITSLIAIDSITVLAGTNGGGIFKTTDKGANWVDVSGTGSGVDHYNINSFAKAGSRIIHTSDGGVWASDDKGVTWIDFNDTNTDHINNSAISYNTTTNEILVVNTVGLYISSSASTTTTPSFSAAQTGLPANTNIRSISNNGVNWYLATDKGVFVSPTGTINWTLVNTALPTVDINTVIPFQTNLIAGTNKEGVYKTSAASISWTANNTNFNNIVTHSMITSGVALVVAATEKGVYVSKDLAASYTRSNKGLTDSLNVTDLAISNGILYAATKNAGMFSSADSGKTWTTFNSGLSSTNLKKIFANGSYLYALASNGDVYEYSSTSWTKIQNGLPAGVTPTSLAFYGNSLLLSTYGHGVYTKARSAAIWTIANTGLSNLNATSVTSLGSKLFAGTDGSGVFVSDSTAINWTATSATSIAHTVIIGLNGSKIQAMATYDGYVFASYKGGLLATSDNGVTWIAGGNQFNLPSYSDVNKISFVTTRVFVTTENNALYSNALSELPVISGVDEQTNNRDSESLILFPNPNNGNFNIGLKNSQMNIKEVSIYDCTGKLIEIISNTDSLKNIELSRNYAAGIYFIRANTELGILTQKTIIE